MYYWKCKTYNPCFFLSRLHPLTVSAITDYSFWLFAPSKTSTVASRLKSLTGGCVGDSARTPSKYPSPFSHQLVESLLKG
ncbi:hypothetical protein L1887_13777 [Cichorium endivia]|nr:hypothetical protein L1887_13777 [Cichorium endivia]